jgi:hypothetical protein
METPIKKRYTYSTEKMRQYRDTYDAKHPTGRKESMKRYQQANLDKYADANKKFISNLKAQAKELKALKEKLKLIIQ